MGPAWSGIEMMALVKCMPSQWILSRSNWSGWSRKLQNDVPPDVAEATGSDRPDPDVRDRPFRSSTGACRKPMNVRDTLVLGIGALVVSAASSQPAADARCPALPPSSGLSWSYSEGPDFGVCYARNPGNPAAGLIGVYLGFAPSFRPSGASIAQDGRMDGNTVHWYNKATAGSGFKVGLETLYELKSGTSHVWILANDRPRMDELRAVAEGLIFKKN